MYAVIKTGGKQYRVKEGDIIDVERLVDLQEGNEVEFKEVLILKKEDEIQVGKPILVDCVVKGEVLGEAKGPKIIAFKFKRRKGSHCKKGHRQKYTRVKITEISL